MVPRGLSGPIISVAIVRPRLRPWSSKRQPVRTVNFCGGTHLVMHIHERSNGTRRASSISISRRNDSRMTGAKYECSLAVESGVGISRDCSECFFPERTMNSRGRFIGVDFE